VIMKKSLKIEAIDIAKDFMYDVLDGSLDLDSLTEDSYMNLVKSRMKDSSKFSIEFLEEMTNNLQMIVDHTENMVKNKPKNR